MRGPYSGHTHYMLVAMFLLTQSVELFDDQFSYTHCHCTLRHCLHPANSTQHRVTANVGLVTLQDMECDCRTHGVMLLCLP
jgi:hypothetical protein